MPDENIDRDDLENTELDNEELDDDNFDPAEMKRELASLKQEREKMSKHLSRANKEAKERRLALKALEDEGLDIESAIEFKRRYEQEEEEKVNKKGEAEKIKEQLTAKYTKDIEQRDSKLSKMQERLYENMVTSRASEAISELNGVPKLLMPYIQKYARVAEDEDNFVVRVLDDDGDVRYNSDGDTMTIKDFVNEMRNDEVFGLAFRAPASSGSGSRPNGGRAEGKGKPSRRSQMPTKEKLAYIAEHGREKFLALPE